MKVNIVAVKRLTRNDCAFKDPQSSSHQIGVNFPKKAFGEMFEDMITNDSEKVVQQNFVVSWLKPSGEEICQSMHSMKFYHSKKELRLVDLRVFELLDYLEPGSLLVFSRENIDLTARIYPPRSENLVGSIYGNDVLTTIPRPRP
jgi:hypothetical protein